MKNTKMQLEIEHMIAETASGQIKSIHGGRDLQKARKLEKQGLATVQHLHRTFCGYGKSYDTGHVANVYKVTFL